ncbi:DUF2169 family type VI secretion system accessory protein [Granulosicoccus antarcticus]|uniref:DUF2169 domain-containing protein n=1 Tax=Granulosicoccus antarcticus IMCC3135 TaxID=1192854 RepID=A0A2Z2P359_9GAMM|nr:DUF2169 domain-containing protein [Granulosicoccus antarcticus]ASJ76798.1 hypothetical protein IMCC3135_33785 [Granulosicoccus antarcticus IMCC3135]
MRLLNHTPFLAAYTLGLAPDGRESVVVVIKATFSIPTSYYAHPELLDEQVALVEADIHTAEPESSAPLYEADYALGKPRCDVTLIGSAYAPNGNPAERVQTGLSVGQINKFINVIGERHWMSNTTCVVTSQPRTFQMATISYDMAFGGTDKAHEDKRFHDAFMLNPVGIGFHRAVLHNLVDGTPAPSTEMPDQPVMQPNGVYKPMSFGPVGRAWQPRIQYAGTYDDTWLDEQFPFLPTDFDNRYYQSAPADQQTNYLQGGEEVTLVNLTPEGLCRFRIPTLEMPVCFFKKKSVREYRQAVIDTLVIEPDQSRFSMTWRATQLLQSNIFEIPEVIIGKFPQTRGIAKPHISSLAEPGKNRNTTDETL